MDMQPLSLVERRSRVEAAREALTGITQVLYQCSGPELAEVLGVVDAVVALRGCGAGRDHRGGVGSW
jgi:hypothetical protein